MYSARNFLRDPYRPFFLLGALEFCAAFAMWYAWRGVLLAGGEGWAWAMPPNFAHAQSTLFGAGLAFVLGFAATAFPRQNGGEPATGSALLIPVITFAVARLLMWLSFWQAAYATALVYAALALQSAALLICLVKFAGLYWQHSRWQSQPLAVLLGLALLLALPWLPPMSWHSFDLALIVAYPLLIFGFGFRLAPFFASRKLADYEMRRGEWTLPIYIALCMLSALCLVAEQTTLFAIDQTLLGLLLLSELFRWRAWRMLREPMLAVMALGLFFLALGHLTSLATLFVGDVFRLERLHLIALGSVVLMLLGISIRVSRGHANIAVKAGPEGIVLFSLAMLALLLRVLPRWIPALPQDGSPAALVLAIVFGLWLLRFVPLLFYRAEP